MGKRFLPLAMISALFLSACSVTVEGGPAKPVRGSGVLVSESRSVSGFSSLVFTGMGEITIIQGQTESLVVEAEDNIVPHIKTDVRGGVLRIGFEREKWQDVIVPTKPIKFTLSVKDLTSVESTGLGSIHTSALAAQRLNVKLSGAGSVKLENVDVTTVSTLVAGAGSIELSGKTNEQSVTLSGLGSYRAGDLSSKKASITVSGAGSATMWVNDTLDITITGAGSVSHYGSPVITKKITGLGSVKSLGVK